MRGLLSYFGGDEEKQGFDMFGGAFRPSGVGYGNGSPYQTVPYNEGEITSGLLSLFRDEDEVQKSGVPGNSFRPSGVGYGNGSPYVTVPYNGVPTRQDIVQLPYAVGGGTGYVPLSSENNAVQGGVPNSQQAPSGQQTNPYYMIGRRPLDFPGGDFLYNDSRSTAREHRQIVGSHGENRGWTLGGAFTEPKEALGVYEFNTKYGNETFDAEKMDRAMREVEEEWNLAKEQAADMGREWNIDIPGVYENKYYLGIQDCQRYVDAVVQKYRSYH